MFEELSIKLRAFFASASATKAVVALSGGLDSAVVVALAVKAIGNDNVTALLLPSRYSSAHSVDDSVEMCRRCDIEYHIIDIEPIFESSLTATAGFTTTSNLAQENMQSRIRCMVTMAYANAKSALMLNTSNRSEAMVGYGTLYGDVGGAVGVIASLYKTEVYDLARQVNAEMGEVIPQNIIDKMPSAELSAGQFDTDSLPSYDILDPILRLIVDQNMSADQIVSTTSFDRSIVERIAQLHRSSAFKRLQSPPAL